MHYNAQIKFDNLTIARGLAALCIVLYHAIGSFGPQDLTNLLFSFGYIAVDLFFVMSGFIISYASKGIFNQVKPKNYTSFILKRLARIYPNHILVILLYLFLFLVYQVLRPHEPAPEKLDLGSLVYFITLTNNILFDKLYWNGPSWSISAEFAAYLAFPFIFLVLARIRRDFMWFICAVSIISLATIYHLNGFVSIGDGITSVGVFRCLFEFICGCTIYFAGSKITKSFLAALTTLLIAGLGILVYTQSNVIFIVSIMVLSTYLMTTQSGKYKIQSTRLAPISNGLIFLGEISYSLYIIHFFVKDVIKLLSTQTFLSSWTSLILYLAASISTAIIIYYYFEIPTRHYLYKKVNLMHGKR